MLLRNPLEVKLMVVLFSQVGQSGWCQEAVLRPVLCHADRWVLQAGVQEWKRGAGDGTTGSVLNFWQTAGSMALFKEQTINSFM